MSKKKGCGCDESEDKQEAVTASASTDQDVETAEEVTSEPVDVLIADASSEDPAAGLPSKWHACLTVEGLRTTDHRSISNGALTWRQLPLAIFAQFKNAGHYEAPIVGQILTIERDEATGRIMATGTFDLTIEDGRQAARMCQNQTLRWGSIDLEVLESQRVEVSVGGTSGGMDLIDILIGDDDDVTDWYDEVLEGRIMGFTMIATPAFPQAVIAPDGVELDIPEPMGTAPSVAPGLMASGVQIPPQPPVAWFADPELTEATPLTITDEGRVFGHLALWNTCFAGETEYLTFSGVRTLKETVGTTQRVLTSTSGFGLANREEREFGGKWVEAEIKPFGVQSLMKVTLRRFGQEKVVYATPNHRWLVTPIGKEGYQFTSREVITTENLEPGARLSPLFPKKRVTIGKGVRPSQFGVAHGVTFGDGTRYRDGCVVDLHGEKDAQLLQYFALSTSTASANANGFPKVRVRNLPAFFKDLPSLNEGISYLYGWLAGYFAADGTVSPKGTPVIFSATREHLEYFRDVCARLGIGTSEIKTYERLGAGEYEGVPGQVSNNRLSPLHRMSLVASTLTSEFFLLSEHRQRFEDRENKRSYTAWNVVSVEETDRVEEVYCAVVPEHENFTLLDNINVMNCHTGFQDVCTVPPHSEKDYAYFRTGEMACEGGERVRVGQITFNTGHAGSTKKWEETAAHYDNTGAAAADVSVGEDEHGVWFAGVLRNGLDDDAIRAIRASALSGDWRKIGGHLELVAALAVNVPGFPIVASLAPSLVAAGMKSDEQVSLITAGLRPRSVVERLAREVAELKRIVSPLVGLSMQQLAQRVNGQPAETPTNVVSIEELRERVNLGGDPSRGTKADKRLKENKPKVAVAK